MTHSPLVKNLQKGLLAWYDFRENSRVLYVGCKEDSLAELLISYSGSVYGKDEDERSDGIRVTIASLSHITGRDFIRHNQNEYDYVVSICDFEKVENPEELLKSFKRILTKDGVCLLGVNNRLSIRYFCGDRDAYTNRNFDGIDNYRNATLHSANEFLGRMYSKSEIDQMLDEIGFNNRRVYSVFPNLDTPTQIYSFGYKPNEDVTNRIFPNYYSPDTVFLEEEYIYPSLIANGMFHSMANSYLYEVSVGDVVLTNALQITASMDRDPDDAMVTIIYDDDHVEKRNVYPEGRAKFNDMIEYAEDLRKHGLKVVPMELTKKGIKMPYIDAPTGQLCLRKLLMNNKDEFLKALDVFYDNILKSSDALERDDEIGMGVTLKYGYPDLVPLNSFYVDGEFIFFDQEFREENYPANVMAVRMISMLYFGNPEFQRIITDQELYDRYNLRPRFRLWKQAEWNFLKKLRNENDLNEYWRGVRRNSDTTKMNRHRMNFKEDDYERWFVDALDKADTRKLILFGSGKYCIDFLNRYGSFYSPKIIVDNQKDKWGDSVNGIQIESPEIIKQLKKGEYKVLICIKNYMPVIKQLQDMDIHAFSVYDPHREYQIKRDIITPELSTERKKYHVGYISGTFDLFHIGHLNMFKRAKELCDYLIVGVVTDEGTKKHKGGVTPFVPFEERLEIVRSCKYVDEAVEIPVDRNGPVEAYAMYHFDVQFNGTDHMYEPYWLEMQKYLREQGADLVFFPYTLSTSSTNLKELIKKELI